MPAGKKIGKVTIVNTILIAVLAVSVVLFFTYGYFGGLKKIIVNIEEQGGETVVYQEIKGEYKQSGAIMDKIYNSLLENDTIATCKGFGKYFDNPEKVDKNQLRSQAGCIIEERDSQNIDRISDRFETMVIPRKKYITTDYPYKNKLSVLFSLIRVYPALKKYAEDNGFDEDSPVMEIYDIPNRKIIYRKEIETKQQSEND